MQPLFLVIVLSDISVALCTVARNRYYRYRGGQWEPMRIGYSIRNPEQTGNVLVSDSITNTSYDYELREKSMRQYGSRGVICLGKKH